MAESGRRILPRVHKPRGQVSDQQRRREIALERQRNARRDLQTHARNLAHLSNVSESHITDSYVADSFVTDSHITGSDTTQFTSSGIAASQNVTGFYNGFLNTPSSRSADIVEDSVDKDQRQLKDEANMIFELESYPRTWNKVDREKYLDSGERERVEDEEVDMVCAGEGGAREGGETERRVGDVIDGGSLWGQKACDWYKNQLMLPEWMVDVPSNLQRDWYVIPRPEGKRCLVISTNGTTVSRLRNGRIFHKFPSSLPNGARTREVAAASHIYCILDCIFHEESGTYCVLDMMSWRGYSLFDCPTEFRFYWVNTKLEESGVLGPTSHFHKYRFQKLPIYDCSLEGLQQAYESATPYKKDGILFYNRHTHYTLGLTPLVLVWKDNRCSQYVIDTDSHGITPPEQLVVLELGAGGALLTSDTPPASLGSLPADATSENLKDLKPGTLIRFSIEEGGIDVTEGLPKIKKMKFQGLAHRRGAGPDSCSKILFQYSARHDPLSIHDLVSSIQSSDHGDDVSMTADDISNLKAGVLTSMSEEDMELIQEHT